MILLVKSSTASNNEKGTTFELCCSAYRWDDDFSQSVTLEGFRPTKQLIVNIAVLLLNFTAYNVQTLRLKLSTNL